MTLGQNARLSSGDEQERVVQALLALAEQAKAEYAAQQSFNTVPLYVNNQLHAFASETDEQTIMALRELGYVVEEEGY